MVILFIRQGGDLTRHEVFHHDTIQIGSASDNDVVLHDYRIDAHHATLHVDDGVFVVRNDQLLAIDDGVLRLTPQIAIEIEHYADRREIAMLWQIARGDDELRAVYADWLEERGAATRAELLRAQLALLERPPCTPEFEALAERIYALAARLPAGWRSCVAHSAITIGDRELGFGLGFARNLRRIAGEPYLTMQLTIGGARASAREVFAPALVTQLERAVDELQRLPEIPHPLVECGAPVLAYRHGGDAVIGRGRVRVRLPMPELRARIDRVIEIVAS